MSTPQPSRSPSSSPHAPPPPELRTAAITFGVQIVVSAVAAVVVYLIAAQQLQDAVVQVNRLQEQRTPVPPDLEATFTSFGNAVLVAILVVNLVIVALEIVMLVLMRRGRNWARIVQTVLAGLLLLGFLIGLGRVFGGFAVGGLDLISSVLQIVAAVLLAVGIVVIYRPNTNAFFRTRSV